MLAKAIEGVYQDVEVKEPLMVEDEEDEEEIKDEAANPTKAEPNSDNPIEIPAHIRNLHPDDPRRQNFMNSSVNSSPAGRGRILHSPGDTSSSSSSSSSSDGSPGLANSSFTSAANSSPGEGNTNANDLAKAQQRRMNNSNKPLKPSQLDLTIKVAGCVKIKRKRDDVIE